MYLKCSPTTPAFFLNHHMLRGRFLMSPALHWPLLHWLKY